MLPKLEAEDELRMVRVAAAANGSMRKTDRDDYLRRLRRQVGGPRRVQTLDDLARAGVPVVMSEGGRKRG